MAQQPSQRHMTSRRVAYQAFQNDRGWNLQLGFSRKNDCDHRQLKDQSVLRTRGMRLAK